MSEQITQGELAALAEEKDALEKAAEAWREKWTAVVDRVKAGAGVQRGYYRIAEHRVFGAVNRVLLVAGRSGAPEMGEFIDLGRSRKVKAKEKPKE